MTLQSFGTSLPAGHAVEIHGVSSCGAAKATLSRARDRRRRGMLGGTMRHRTRRDAAGRPRARTPGEHAAPRGSRAASCCLPRCPGAVAAQPAASKPRRWCRRSRPVAPAPPSRGAGSRSGSPTARSRPSTAGRTSMASSCCTRTPSAPPAAWRIHDLRYPQRTGRRMALEGKRADRRRGQPRRREGGFARPAAVRLRRRQVAAAVRRSHRLLHWRKMLSGRELPYATAPVRLGRPDSGRHGDRASVHAPGADAGRGERPGRRRRVAIPVAQPVRRLPPCVRRGAGQPRGRRRADRYRQHGWPSTRGTATSVPSGERCGSRHDAPRYAAP